jgi:glycosyltransferase involved in cell wall biosynthesis
VRVAVVFEQCWHRVPGGTARATIDQAAAVQANGAEVELVGVAARHRQPAPEAWRPSVHVAQLPLPRPVLYEAWHTVRWPRVEMATGHVDLVHATAVAFPAATAPVVATVHDLAFLDDPTIATRRGLRFFRRGTELARSRARLVMCPSEATREDCVRAGFDPGRLRVVPWGIRVARSTCADVRAVLQRYRIERPFVLFSGTHEPRKNLRGLVGAFRRLARDDIELVLTGPVGWREDTPSLLRGLEGRARALGFVPQDDLRALYAGASVFCYPSLREGFGLPVLEAMAQGSPVVTSSTTATAEVAGDAALTVDPRDIDAIAAAVERLLDDTSLATRLREAGPAQAATYSWDRTAEATIDVYVESTRGRSPQ